MTTFEQRLRETLSHTYDIERELGGGGMSRVFVAIERSLGRKVVIKLLSPELTADVNRGRFRREMQVAAQLQHPHIVPLLAAGEHEELVYYTMPFIAGESLKTAVESHGPLSIPDAVRVMYHVSEALDYAHGEGVVHRDIKPANILRSGTYSLITDFGVAKALNAAMPSAGMTSTGMAIGTPAYMSPEQLAGDALADHRIDIYAVGLLAYELLHGKSPFAGTTPQRVLAAVLTQDPKPLVDVRPEVPRRLSEIVMTCLSKEPNDRPTTAKALLAELDTFSTASGEIRTMEHRIPRKKTPVSTEIPTVTADEVTEPVVHATPAEEGHVVALTPTDGIPVFEAPPPKKSGSKKMLVGALALLVPIAAGAIFLSQRGNTAPSDPGALVDSTTLVMADSTAVGDSVPVQLPGAALAPGAVVPAVDSQAIADSVRKARADAAKKAAARDSARKKKAADSAARATTAPTPAGTINDRARRAASAMLNDAAASRSFARGATRMGGPLGTRRRGDLQTQIDALQPFLATAGLSYEQFKSIVQGSGIAVYDEFGRMVPDSLRRFAGN